ncbi:MAG: transcription-repair coupling factor, partial [Chitinivibrionales bacterium]|nr:transcription-repair coupling factor [Chitinivibrionales bacterium]
KNYERHWQRVAPALQPLVSAPQQLLFSDEEISGAFDCFQRVYLDTLETPAHTAAYPCAFTEPQSLSQNIGLFIDQLRKLKNDGFTTMMVCRNSGHAQRLVELLDEQVRPLPAAADTVTEETAAAGVESIDELMQIYTGYLDRGFIDALQRRAVLTDNQGPPERSLQTKLGKKPRSSDTIASFDALAPGDYVVHVDHGIGKFLGVERLSSGPLGQDCMVLLYLDNAKLYVPVTDFAKVRKYIGKDSFSPALSKLGSGQWERIKERTRDSLKEMANELIELYAKRQYMEGISFGKDTPWQREFEDAFLFEPTPDQVRAIGEVKNDMEAKKPMDRLVCGDVGFGKTEVAMRAAFKAVMAGYQVALLTPTTILAAQHFVTLTARMADFPVRIGMLSRFLGPAEQKVVLDKVKNGLVDIVVGTHRLFSKDIVFKNLGLLIIDEEQRFGVRHKEKLKQYRTGIDVLSLTATPIPRTLHLSLIGARDLSIITTPPRNRLPIETQVAAYHDDLVKTAIESELERGGQVYVVNNRIGRLEPLRDTIERLVPAARVAIAHGQMDERELAAVMKEFIAGRFDVLLSTVIIENGLDIPNVNTVIVIRADAMGLSQLYQLRGRVGRSAEQAYAYLLTPPFREVNERALRRLQALEQYTELGSGFAIAMRDLEIRGAGNILGTRQHGFIAAVGFELYCKLLEEAVHEIKGEAPAPQARRLTLEIPLRAYIPTEYIADGSTRITIYQDCALLADTAGLDDVQQSLVDRFGPMPEPVAALLLLMRIKIMAGTLSCSKIAISDAGELKLFFEGGEADVKSAVQTIVTQSDRRFEMVYEQPLCLKTTLASKEPTQAALETKLILETILAKKTPLPAQK